jgi:hypothetical protein
MNKKIFGVLLGCAFLLLVVSCRPNPTPAATQVDQPTNQPPAPTNTPAPTPTDSVDFQIRRFANRVFFGLDAPLPELLDDQFHPFPEGSQTNTDDIGIALLEGSAAVGNCRIFVFTTTTLKKSACQPGTFAGSNSSCVEAGSALFNNCSGHIVISASGVAEHKFTALSATYLPEQQITFFYALEGAVEVTPLRELGNYDNLAESVQLEAGQYLYTAPDERMIEMMGIPMRVPQQADTIRPLLDELQMWDWMEQTQRAVDSEGLPIEVVPPQPVARFVMNVAGGPLDDPAGQQAILQAVPWQDLTDRVTDGQEISFSVSGFSQGEPLDARNYPYDQAKAAAVLRNLNYGQGFGAIFIVPEGNDTLRRLAQSSLPSLLKLGIEASIRETSDDEVQSLVASLLSQEVPFFWLTALTSQGY